DDVMDFLNAKNWGERIPGTSLTQADAKKIDFDYPCPLDMTNISVNYGDSWLSKESRWEDEVFRYNILQAAMTGEPGFSFNFGSRSRETLRNACTEITSEDDSDVCNLGSINLSRVKSLS